MMDEADSEAETALKQGSLQFSVSSHPTQRHLWRSFSGLSQAVFESEPRLGPNRDLWESMTPVNYFHPNHYILIFRDILEMAS